MRNFSKVALAVASALTGAAAFALPPNTVFDPNNDVKLVVSGSSAFRDSFKQEMATLCSDTLDTYQTQSGGPDFRAYTCTLNAASGLNGKKAQVYYRSEGGSVWGAVTTHKTNYALGTPINRLSISNACTGASPTYTCNVTGYSLLTDNTVTNLVKDTSLLGVSDEEPAMFIGANRPSVPVAVATSNAPAPDAAVGQTFAVYVNSGVSATAINLSKQSLTSIFSGLYVDWNTVPNAAGTGFVVDPNTSSLPIVLCKRDVGSGTQVSADVYFNGTNCSPAAYPFASSTVALNNSTGAELTCVSTNAGGIGYASIQTSVPAGTSIVNIDGITPSRVNAANGIYGYSFELVFLKAGVPGGASGEIVNGATLRNNFITRLKNSATTPASPNNTIYALPVGTNVPVLPVDANRPVGLGTRGGNSCANPANQNG